MRSTINDGLVRELRASYSPADADACEPDAFAEFELLLGADPGYAEWLDSADGRQAVADAELDTMPDIDPTDAALPPW